MNNVLVLVFSIFLIGACFSQDISEYPGNIDRFIDRFRAEDAVSEYIESTICTDYELYIGKKFHEAFVQPNPNAIYQNSSCQSDVVFSVSHSYWLDDSLISFDYFHLSKSYEVLCRSTAAEMLSSSSRKRSKRTGRKFKVKKDDGEPESVSEDSSTIKCQRLSSNLVFFPMSFKTVRDSSKKIISPFTSETEVLASYDSDYFLGFMKMKHQNPNSMYGEGIMHTIALQLIDSLETHKGTDIDLVMLFDQILLTNGQYDRGEIQSVRFIMSPFEQESLAEGELNLESTITGENISEFVQKKTQEVYSEGTKLRTAYYVSVKGEEKLIYSHIRSNF